MAANYLFKPQHRSYLLLIKLNNLENIPAKYPSHHILVLAIGYI